MIRLSARGKRDLGVKNQRMGGEEREKVGEKGNGRKGRVKIKRIGGGWTEVGRAENVRRETG